jgi:GNAT superfamily N-acetyltransferase
MLHARLARQEDLDGLLKLYKELRPHDPVLDKQHATQSLHELLANPEINLVVVETDQQLTATCMLAIIPTLTNGAKPFGIIEHVVTTSSMRGRGIGNYLLRYTLEMAWQRECYKVMLLSGQQRLDAHRVYEKLGFRGDIEKGYVIKPAWYS